MVRRAFCGGREDLAGALETADPGGESIAAAELHVTDRASVERFAARGAELGTVRGLVNRAGTVRFTPISGFDAAAASPLWEVNVAGTARVCAAAVAQMSAAGAIVNISSITGYTGRLRGASLYSASKAGLVAFTRYLASELASRSIRVNGLAPGYIAVPMSPSVHAISGGEEELIKQVPLERLEGDPRDGRRGRVPALRPQHVHQR